MSANQAEPATEPASPDPHHQAPAKTPTAEPEPPDRPHESGARPTPLSRLLYP
ncbi:hypothetical protein [Streptomyces sp. A1277]|uniref:hypothetical protein n=1 Tax=Streptomyces sp. A1277 TaxID=2563103 RepID=UPI00144723D5|nr:hypothetical protein [Streptomyces sp. A1277]